MTTIALNKLTPWRGNVRKTGAHEGIDALAASIAAHGLLTSLVVRKAPRGKYAVIAGHRRYLALSALAGDGKIPADLAVECHLVEADADGTEISLAENVMREPMHPADQFEAFRDLIDKGSTAADVAARFGVSEATVTRRMKLGRVSPAILDAYRAGQLSLEQVQAFTVSDDHTAQERVWAGLGEYACNPYAIRCALTEGELPVSDKRVCFIGLEAYEAAGGGVRRDLFDDQSEGYILDIAVLDRLVQQALEAQAESIRAEGWKWVEIHPDFTYQDRALFQRCHPQDVALPDAEAEELETLIREYAALSDRQYSEDGDDDPEVTLRMEQIEERIDELQALSKVWTDDIKAMSGVILSLSHDGSLNVEYGLIRPEDAAERSQPASPPSPDDAQDAPATALPARLIQDLTAQRSAAIAVELAHQPDVALATVVHALARSVFFDYGAASCLKIAATITPLARSMAKPEECSGFQALGAERSAWATRLPGNPEDLWTWCLGQTQDTLLQLLALCAGHTVDAVRGGDTRFDAAARLAHADALAKALSLTMQTWFTPTAMNYFGRVSRNCILEALSEAGVPARTRSWAKLKKTELALLAERDIAGTGWLPQPLRMAGSTVQPEPAATDMPLAEAA